MNHLFDSHLNDCFRLSQFEVGSAGRTERRTDRLLRILASPFQLVARLMRDLPSVVHINTSYEWRGYWRDLTYMAAAKVFRRKVVYQVHGGPYPQKFFAKSRVLTALLRRSLCWPDVVVVLSSQHMKAFAEFAPDARIMTIPYGVEVERANLSFWRYARERPLEVVFMGRLVVPKGVFELVEGIRILRTRGIPIRVRLAGGGPDEKELRRAVTAAGLDDCITFVGSVYGAAKLDLWRSANVLLLPTHREGLPLALLESMAAGVVPVITPVGGIPDAVQNGVQGLLISPRSPVAVADALQVLHEDRNLLWRMAVAGHRQALERFSVRRFAADFHTVYGKLAQPASQ